MPPATIINVAGIGELKIEQRKKARAKLVENRLNCISGAGGFCTGCHQRPSEWEDLLAELFLGSLVALRSMEDTSHCESLIGVRAVAYDKMDDCEQAVVRNSQHEGTLG